MFTIVSASDASSDSKEGDSSSSVEEDSIIQASIYFFIEVWITLTSFMGGMFIFLYSRETYHLNDFIYMVLLSSIGSLMATMFFKITE